jgi:hypothetical protein
LGWIVDPLGDRAVAEIICRPYSVFEPYSRDLIVFVDESVKFRFELYLEGCETFTESATGVLGRAFVVTMRGLGGLTEDADLTLESLELRVIAFVDETVFECGLQLLLSSFRLEFFELALLVGDALFDGSMLLTCHGVFFLWD